MKWHSLAVLIYALLVIVGGVVGYLKAQSHISLIMGMSTGLLLLVSSYAILNGQAWGLQLAFSVTTFLIFVFGYRYYLTQGFFPSGFMTLLSTVTLLFLSFLPKK